MIPISRGSSYISRDAKMVKNKTKLTRSIFSFWWFWLLKSWATNDVCTRLPDVINPNRKWRHRTGSEPIGSPHFRNVIKKVTKRPILLYLQLIQNRKTYWRVEHSRDRKWNRKWMNFRDTLSIYPRIKVSVFS